METLPRISGESSSGSNLRENELRVNSQAWSLSTRTWDGAGHQDRDTGPPGGISSLVKDPQILHVGLMGQKAGFGLEAMGMGGILSLPCLKFHGAFLYL